MKAPKVIKYKGAHYVIAQDMPSAEEYLEWIQEKVHDEVHQVASMEASLSLTDDAEPEKSKLHLKSALENIHSSKALAGAIQGAAKAIHDAIEKELKLWGLAE